MPFCCLSLRANGKRLCCFELRAIKLTCCHRFGLLDSLNRVSDTWWQPSTYSAWISATRRPDIGIIYRQEFYGVVAAFRQVSALWPSFVSRARFPNCAYAMRHHSTSHCRKMHKLYHYVMAVSLPLLRLYVCFHYFHLLNVIISGESLRASERRKNDNQIEFDCQISRKLAGATRFARRLHNLVTTRTSRTKKSVDGLMNDGEPKSYMPLICTIWQI